MEIANKILGLHTDRHTLSLHVSVMTYLRQRIRAPKPQKSIFHLTFLCPFEPSKKKKRLSAITLLKSRITGCCCLQIGTLWIRTFFLQNLVFYFKYRWTIIRAVFVTNQNKHSYYSQKSSNTITLNIKNKSLGILSNSEQRSHVSWSIGPER